MIHTLSPEQFLQMGNKIPIVDVRSPGEFEKGHIPGAVNLAIFNNDERAEVGTLYKQIGKKEAILRGLEIVGPKMADFVREAEKLSQNNQLLVHCWRGGMRSESMAWLFAKADIESYLLGGGYKAYRNYILDRMSQFRNLIIIKGLTGSGKTDILYELEALDEQIIDLEKLANHRGSAFGGIGQPEQPTTQQFHNELFDRLSKFDDKSPIWIEGESKAIGQVFLPLPFWETMYGSRVIEIHVPLQDRINRLVKEYSNLDSTEMENAIMKLEKRLGNKRMLNILKSYRDHDYIKVSELLLEYYDRTYKVSISRNTRKHENLSFTNGNTKEIALTLLNYKTETVPDDQDI